MEANVPRLFEKINNYCRNFIKNNKTTKVVTGDVVDVFNSNSHGVDHNIIDRFTNIRLLGKKKLMNELSTICHLETNRVRRSLIWTFKMYVFRHYYDDHIHKIYCKLYVTHL
jgi:hypothetical protein